MAKYIEKEKVINELQYNNKVTHYSDDKCEDIVYRTAREMQQLVFEMPAADVQPIRRGEWKYYKNNGIIDTYICSNCENKVEMAIDVEPSSFCYCPKCGALMNE